MPPKASSSALSDSEMQLLCNYCRCMKSKPDIDMEKFANISGFGNVPSARANIGHLLAKILAEQQTSGDASPAKDTEDGETIAVTPASKKKAGGRKRKTDAAEIHGAEDESPTKNKASPTKRNGKAATKAASEEEDTQVKSEAGESAGDGADA
ncbi:hypothetical protein MBLNU13_g10061t2 [Cladosporium sp. NU13]